MGKYGEAAVAAARAIAKDDTLQPKEAWQSAVKTTFPHSSSLQYKSCPKIAFLALCQMGNVRDVAAGNYTTSEKNKRYMECALTELRLDPELSNNAHALWVRAVGHDKKSHNAQMDVLISLFLENLIR
ncbi:DUF6979 family protein [Roseibium algae]|uniref:Uncharacterized protein n=1 Tax=Roseibium algae TaxID=3123038 RepID=A0ABU8TTG5_9HYPH